MTCLLCAGIDWGGWFAGRLGPPGVGSPEVGFLVVETADAHTRTHAHTHTHTNTHTHTHTHLKGVGSPEVGFLVVKNAKFLGQIGQIIRTIGVDKIRSYLRFQTVYSYAPFLDLRFEDVLLKVCVCVCVCVKERESARKRARERESQVVS